MRFEYATRPGQKHRTYSGKNWIKNFSERKPTFYNVKIQKINKITNNMIIFQKLKTADFHRCHCDYYRCPNCQ